mgnify:FL=1
MSLRLLLDIRPAQANVLQRLITEAGEQHALAVELIPTPEFFQHQVRRETMVGNRINLLVRFLTFHRLALRCGWLKCRAGFKINPTNVLNATHLGD